MQQELRALLMGDAAIAAIAGTRIDWGVSAQGAPLPRVVLHLIGDNVQGHTFAGGDQFYQGRVQINCYAKTYGGAVALGNAVAAKLDGLKAASFRGVFCLSQRDEYAPGSNEGDRPFGRQLDFATNWRI